MSGPLGGRRSVAVALGVAVHDARSLRKNPPMLLSPLLVPLFFFAAFAGALSAIARTRGFGYYDYTAFVFVFIVIQAGLFSGVFSALDVGRDYETGLAARLMVATPRRMAIVAGYALMACARAAIALAILWAVALATGMPVRGDVLDLVALNALALLLTLVGVFCGAGVALRFQSSASGVLVMIPTFVVLFLTPLFEQRQRLTGWLRIAADVNPLTAVLESGRGEMAGHATSVALAFGAAAGLLALSGAFALSGMRRAERGPGAPRGRLHVARLVGR